MMKKSAPTTTITNKDPKPTQFKNPTQKTNPDKKFYRKSHNNNQRKNINQPKYPAALISKQKIEEREQN
jgi:hypothetical protein